VNYVRRKKNRISSFRRGKGADVVCGRSSFCKGKEKFTKGPEHLRP
jgi:hypothetical protein